MAFFYKLEEFGFKLSSGSHVISSADFLPVEQSNKLLSAAEKRSSTIVGNSKQAYEKAKRQGYDEGLKRARVDNLRLLLEETENLDITLSKLSSELVTLVVSCVRKIIEGIDYKVQAEALVRSALNKMRKEQRIECKASPEVYDFLRNRVDVIKADFPEIELIYVSEDPSLKGSLVVVSSGLGRVVCDTTAAISDLENIVMGFGARYASDHGDDRPVDDLGDDGVTVSDNLENEITKNLDGVGTD